jgi:glucosamine--fructose-6-phosphate aminotransferase (isomerizing)
LYKSFEYHMASEAAQALGVYRRAAARDVQRLLDGAKVVVPSAIYSIARGSSDAVANILSYEFMRELAVPFTSLPPSVFSLGGGLQLNNAVVLVVSQSGQSEDLLKSANGAVVNGAKLIAITNQSNSPVEMVAHLTISIDAGSEHAIPATKTVVGAIGAGAALLSAFAPDYRERHLKADAALPSVMSEHPDAHTLQSALLSSRHVYVVGRDTGYGAACEVALKLKECCALHAEAYSSAEVLHGPLQLATNPLMVLILDTGSPHIQASLDLSESRFRDLGCDVFRIKPADIGVSDVTPALAAVLLLTVMYPIILKTALSLGFNPDVPTTLSKVTQTI